MFEPTAEQLDRITEAFCQSLKGRTDEGVVFDEIHRVNACSYTFAGTLTDETGAWEFAIASGDLNGTDVIGWRPADTDAPAFEVVDEPSTPRVLIPANASGFLSNPGRQQLFRFWMREEWFTRMEAAYNYDRHFQPGMQVENAYREKAAKRGLTWGDPDTREALLQEAEGREAGE